MIENKHATLNRENYLKDVYLPLEELPPVGPDFCPNTPFICTSTLEGHNGETSVNFEVWNPDGTPLEQDQIRHLGWSVSGSFESGEVNGGHIFDSMLSGGMSLRDSGAPLDENPVPIIDFYENENERISGNDDALICSVPLNDFESILNGQEVSIEASEQNESVSSQEGAVESEQAVSNEQAGQRKSSESKNPVRNGANMVSGAEEDLSQTTSTLTPEEEAQIWPPGVAIAVLSAWGIGWGISRIVNNWANRKPIYKYNRRGAEQRRAAQRLEVARQAAQAEKPKSHLPSGADLRPTLPVRGAYEFQHSDGTSNVIEYDCHSDELWVDPEAGALNSARNSQQAREIQAEIEYVEEDLARAWDKWYGTLHDESPRIR